MASARRKAASAALSQESSEARTSQPRRSGGGESPRPDAAQEGERGAQSPARARSSEGLTGLLPRPPLPTPRMAGGGRDPAGSGRVRAAPPLISKGLQPQCPAVACSPETRPTPKDPARVAAATRDSPGVRSHSAASAAPDTSCRSS